MRSRAEAFVKRVPETVPEEVAKVDYHKLDQDAEIATVAKLIEYDAIILGVSTRFGMMGRSWQSFPPKRSEQEFEGATHQGHAVAEIAAKLSA